MQKVLIIAYYFPPAGGVGTFRVAKFVKFLPQNGWEPIVVTVTPENYLWIDKSLEKNVPKATKIYRLPVSMRCIINDEGTRWLPYLIRHIGFIVREEKPNIAYLTGGPFFHMVSAQVLKHIWKLPYIIDLRDPWKLEKKVSAKNLKNMMGNMLTNILEPWIIKGAARVICATQQMTDEYRKLYKHESQYKFVTIRNGYDQDDFSVPLNRYFDRFTILYTGKFTLSAGFRDPTQLLRALKILHEGGLDLQFVHIGEPEQRVLEIARAVGVAAVVKSYGKMDYAETIAYSKAADILLLIGAGGKIEQTGKIFDYLGCQKPVLALSPLDGGIGEIVSQIPHAKLISNGDPLEIAGTIKEISRNRTHSDVIAHTEVFERKYLTEILALNLKDIVSKNNVR